MQPSYEELRDFVLRYVANLSKFKEMVGDSSTANSTSRVTHATEQMNIQLKAKELAGKIGTLP